MISFSVLSVHRCSKYRTSLETGLLYNHAERQQLRYEMGPNIIPPPLDCPAWLCCLLPCLLKTKKLKYFQSLQVKVVEASLINFFQFMCPGIMRALLTGASQW